MNFSRLAALLLVLLPFCALAQSEEDVAKERQRRIDVLVENALADVPNLRLPENRAIVLVKAGNLVWKNDTERARSLFQSAITELINAQNAAEAEKKGPYTNSELLMGQSTRPTILGVIAARDAELALEYLHKTRPPALARAIAGQKTRAAKIGNGPVNIHLVQNELNMEQRFMHMAAQQKPERAAKYIKDAIAKGISGETFNLLRKLSEKDPETAANLASEVGAKLLDGKWMKEMQPDYQSINLASQIVTEFIREKSAGEKSVRFEEPQVRALAHKLITFHIEQTQRNAYSAVHTAVQIAEKLFPGEVERLKKLQQANPRYGLIAHGWNAEIGELTKPETPIEKMLGEAKNFPVESRRPIYNAAANRMVQEGNFGGAASLLKEHFDEDALEQEMRNLNSNYASTLLHAGRFDEAETVIMEMPEDARTGLLINLAQTIYAKEPKENHSRASAVLRKARAVLPERVETANEMSGLMQIINAYSTIDPAEAFQMLEPLIPQINELTRANIVINSFHGNGNVKQGEMVIVQGTTFGIHIDQSLLNRLSEKDFERTVGLINSFERRETRIGLAVQLAESIPN